MNRTFVWTRALPFAFLIIPFMLFFSHEFSQIHSPSLSCEGIVLKVLEKFCAPEPEERLYYFTAVFIPTFLILISRFLPANWIRMKNSPESNVIALSYQLFFSLFVIWMWIYQNQKVHEYVSQWHLYKAALLSLILLFFEKPILHRIKKIKHLKSFQKISHLPSILVFFLISLFLFPLFYRENFITHSGLAFVYNTKFTMGEYVAALNGLIPRADFFPQYSGLLSWLSVPIFKLFGMGLAQFSLWMICLTGSWLALVYYVFYKVTDSRWKGLAYFYPILMVSFLPIQNFQNNVWSALSSFATSPNRLFFPMLIGAFLSNQTFNRKNKNLLWIPFLAALGAINNIDFGVPASVGCGIVIFLFMPKNSYKIYFTSALIFILTLFSHAILVRVFSGLWPDWSAVTQFQKVFAYYGFFAIPLPHLGLLWLILAIFFTGLIKGLQFNEKLTPPRLSVGLIYFSLLGLTSLPYYFSRSHWEVLQSYFSIVMICSMLILIHIREESKPNRLTLFPKYWFTFIWVLGVTLTASYPSIRGQFHRAFLALPNQEEAYVQHHQILKSLTQPNEQVWILHPDGFYLAYQMNLKNKFPFTQTESVLLLDQLKLALKFLDRDSITKVFGIIPNELRIELERRNFKEQPNSLFDFSIWIKSKD